MLGELERAKKLIKAGDVVAFPTETVYGLGADARNRDAISRVFQLKKRPADNPLIVHIGEIDQIYDFASEVPEAAIILARHFWPGPLTIILPKKPEVLDIVTGGLATVALRMPDHKIALELIRDTAPLVAPSANKSGRPSPTKPEHVKADFSNEIEILDGGPCKLGLESTVVRVDHNEVVILRPGHIDPEKLEEISGLSVRYNEVSEQLTTQSPGMKYSHYAPNAEVSQATDIPDKLDPNTLYLIIGSMSVDNELPDNVLPYFDNLNRFAEELYDRFRQADLEGFGRIKIIGLKDPGDSGIAKALQNRIEKAAQAR